LPLSLDSVRRAASYHWVHGSRPRTASNRAYMGHFRKKLVNCLLPSIKLFVWVPPNTSRYFSKCHMWCNMCGKNYQDICIRSKVMAKNDPRKSWVQPLLVWRANLLIFCIAYKLHTRGRDTQTICCIYCKSGWCWLHSHILLWQKQKNWPNYTNIKNQWYEGPVYCSLTLSTVKWHFFMHNLPHVQPTVLFY